MRKGALGAAYQPPPPPPSAEAVLNVGLYPYVPSPPAFASAVEAVWLQLRPDVALEFVFYDPYTGPPPPTLDVFAFDCIYVDDLIAAGQVDPLAAQEIDALEDVMPFAQQNALVNPDAGTFAGIPYLGCTSVLFYRRGDPALDNDKPLGVADLHAILGDASYPGPLPPLGAGLLMDLGGKTTDACIYAALWRALHDCWWPAPLPTNQPLDADVLAELRAYATMAGRAQALFDDVGHERTEWFAEGHGRALVGLTETMSAWAPDTLAQLAFRPLPIAPSGAAPDTPLYADAVGIRPGLGDERATAVQLANVIASATVGLAAMTPTGLGAQYLIPARQSVLDALATQLPQYTAIAAMLADCAPAPFRLGPGVRDWARPTGLAIMTDLFPVAAPEEAIATAAPVSFQPRRRHHAYHRTPAGLWRRER
jgi:thiamine pyridinylase